MNSPAQIAKNYLNIGKGKANTPIPKMIVLGILAGMFIAMAGVGATAAGVKSGNGALGAFVFPGGLAMVLIAGSELFTGNNLIIIPVLQGEVSAGAMLKNWVFVYLGNLIGSIIVAAIAVYGGVSTGGFAVAALSAAAGKCSLSFTAALLKGIGCNFLVCIAVWMSFGATDVAGKIIAQYLPIMIFVIAGFEHSVANMYYISCGIFTKAKLGAEGLASLENAPDVTNITWGKMFATNLLPVTLGNIIGGAVLVGCVYWYLYLKDNK